MSTKTLDGDKTFGTNWKNIQFDAQLNSLYGWMDENHSATLDLSKIEQ